MAKARSYKQIDEMVSELEDAKRSIVEARDAFTGTLVQPFFSAQRMASRFDGVSEKIDYLISVIINVYNGEKYINKWLDSIINQTYTNWELIIVNDCSKDNTIKVIEKYIKEHKKIFR